ncbi:carbohydrate porin [Sphingomonas parapaucimobilis]|uniref:carbohydrate porin n=1 Tax=Sphingomonas parapaucimobilis TaxID=28213 RepID=UPI0039E79E45
MIRIVSRAALCGLFLVARAASAQDTQPQDFAIHGQATLVAQGVGGFASPYTDANSLTPRQVKETADVTAFIGVRAWTGGELWVNPEIDQGFGLSNTLGVAGFPSAEAYKVGKAEPYFRLQRAFFRQTFGLGGTREAVAGVANQLGGSRSLDRVVLTIGKFGVGDLFDTNPYAHDPRGDFLNWSAVDTGSFDYAADAWGYTTGVAAELYRGDWTLRTGLFNLSTVPNGERLEHGFGQYQIDAEVEHRHQVAGRPGSVRFGFFRNRGNFSRFDEALAYAATTGGAVDSSVTRRRMTRIGGYMNMDQALTDTLGLFARVGVSDGSIEPYDFTDIDRTAQIGGSLNGKSWGRAQDRVGMALIANGISAEHRRYLAAGGLGVLVGDGKLPDAGAEEIAEAYYDVALTRALAVTLDAQYVENPGYNRDRGPAEVFALRVHGAF